VDEADPKKSGANPSEPLVDKWSRRARSNPILAVRIAGVAVVVFIAGGIEAISVLTRTGESVFKSSSHDPLAQEDVVLENLSVASPFSTLRSELGAPDLTISPRDSGVPPQRPGLLDHWWVIRAKNKPVGLVLARADHDGVVVLLAFVALAPSFQPTFRPDVFLTKGKTLMVQLNRTTLSDALGGSADAFSLAPPAASNGGGYYFEAVTTAGDLRSYIVGQSGLGQEKLPLALITAMGGEQADQEANSRGPYLATGGRLTRSSIQGLRTKTLIDTYAVTNGASLDEAGVPWLNPPLLLPFQHG
jgi:hypothetical protein